MKKLKNIMSVGLLFFVLFSFIISSEFRSLDELWNYNFAKNVSEGLVPYKDFNMVITPFLSMIVAIFLKFIFNGLFMTRILAAVLGTGILVMTYLVLNKLFENKYLKLLIVLILTLIMIPYFCLDYNFFNLLLVLIILNFELKDREEKLLKLNYKKDFLVGILAGLAILTKQSTGLVIAITYVLYKWLAIRNKEDFKLAFKISLSRGLGVLSPVIIFFMYLLLTNSLNDFISFCIFGVMEFSNSLSYMFLFKLYEDIWYIEILAFMVPLVILFSLIYLIRNYKFETLESINVLKLFVFGIASFAVTFPIADAIHFLIGSFLLVILAAYFCIINIKINNEKICDNLNKLFIYFTYVLCAMLIVVTIFNYYKYINDDEKNHNLKHYENLSLDKDLVQQINDINGYIKNKEIEGKKVYIADSDACLYNVTADRYNKYFDLLLKGNLGKNGVENVICILSEFDKGSLVFIKGNKENLNWQIPLDVIYYIMENFEKVDSISLFDVYVKK